MLIGPGNILFYGYNTIQQEDHTINNSVDAKLGSGLEYVLSRHCRKQFDQRLNEVEKASLSSRQCTLEWIGPSGSSFCSFYASS